VIGGPAGGKQGKCGTYRKVHLAFAMNCPIKTSTIAITLATRGSTSRPSKIQIIADDAAIPKSATITNLDARLRGMSIFRKVYLRLREKDTAIPAMIPNMFATYGFLVLENQIKKTL